jgi:hypothetical protein
MKLQKYFLLSAILGLATFSSCSEDSICEPLKLTFSVQNLGSTSSSINSSAGVGLWVSSTSVSSLGDADVAKNHKFIPNGQEMTSEGVNWTGQQKLYTYAYYPYSSSASSSPEAYAVSASANPNLMWAKAETTFQGENVSPKLSFRHMMSKLVLNVKSDAKESGALVGGAVTLKGFKDAATANLLNGQITATGSASDVTPAAITAASGYEGTYEAVLVPQALDAGFEFLTMVTTNDVTIKGALESALSLESGQEVTLEVILKEEECVVKVQEIKAWDVDAEQLDAEAEKVLPTVELLDLYDFNGIQGIVIAIDEDSEGKHGWVVSLDEAQLKGRTTSSQIEGWTGNQQLTTQECWERVLTQDPTLEEFPAFQWVDNMNAESLTLETLAENEDTMVGWRWTLPAITDAHFKAFIDLLFDPFNPSMEANVAKFNNGIEAAKASNKKKLPAIDWTDYYADLTRYMSGSVCTGSSIMVAQIASFTYADALDWGELYLYTKDDIIFFVQDGITIKMGVRAFRRF